jgi:UDP-4-amino-4,6-dideoxy-N-acetyl-beta-L-altrosamine N-acetyltransferase
MELAKIRFVGLRKLDSSIAADIRHWRNAPHVSRYMFSRRAVGEAEHADFIDRLKADPDRELYVFYINGVPKGVLQYELRPDARRVSMGYYLKEERDMFGSYGVFAKFLFIEYAFIELGAHKVFGEALKRNEKVLALHERFGYTLEGALREHVPAAGGDGYDDVFQYGLLRSEWLRGPCRESIGAIVWKFVERCSLREIFAS